MSEQEPSAAVTVVGAVLLGLIGLAGASIVLGMQVVGVHPFATTWAVTVATWVLAAWRGYSRGYRDGRLSYLIDVFSAIKGMSDNGDGK